MNLGETRLSVLNGLANWKEGRKSSTHSTSGQEGEEAPCEIDQSKEFSRLESEEGKSGKCSDVLAVKTRIERPSTLEQVLPRP